MKRRLLSALMTLSTLTVVSSAFALPTVRALSAYSAFAPWPTRGDQTCLQENWGAIINACSTTQPMVFYVTTDSIDDKGNNVAGSQNIGFSPAGTFNGGFSCYAEAITYSGAHTAGNTVVVNSGNWSSLSLASTATTQQSGTIRLVCTGVHPGEGIQTIVYSR